MPLRKYKIASRPFASIGTAILTNQWNSRLKELHAQLLTDIPSLKSLKASDVKLSFEPTEKSVNLTAHLLESSQLSLPSDNANSDLFLQDVQRVVQDQQIIEDRIALAIGPAVNPADDPEVIEVRQRLRTPKTRGPVVIWTAPDATTLQLFELPKVLPLAPKTSVRLNVNSLTTASAEVTLLEGLAITDHQFIDKGTTITLKRAGEHCKPTSGERLQYAMDTKGELEIEVAIVLEWENGKPTCLELLGFVDKKPEQ